MANVSISLSEVVLEQLRNEAAGHDAVDQAREFVVLGLFKRHAISSGVAARELGMTKLEFMRLASANGIPVFELDDEQLAREISNVLAP